MKFKVFFLFLLLVACTSSKKAVSGNNNGNGRLITKEINVSDYEEIDFSGNISMNSGFSKGNKVPVFYYSQQKGKSSLQITIDENLYPQLKIETTGKKLIISTIDRNSQIKPTRLEINGSSNKLRSINNTGCIDFIAQTPLNTDEMLVRITGSSDIRLEKTAKIDDCKISISGSGNFHAENLICDFMNSSVSGSGNISLKGEANRAEYRISGSGNINAYGFIVKDLECSVGGSGNLKVYASKNLNARTSGSGNIRYKGNASVTKSKTGSGGIDRAD